MVGFKPPADRQARREWWRSQIERHKRSNLSVTLFCSQLGVRPKAFYAWRQRLSTRSSSFSRASVKRESHLSASSNGAPTAPFLPVAIRDNGSPGRLEIELSNSCVLRVTGTVDPALLRVAIDGAGRLIGKRRGTY